MVVSKDSVIKIISRVKVNMFKSKDAKIVLDF